MLVLCMVVVGGTNARISQNQTISKENMDIPDNNL